MSSSAVQTVRELLRATDRGNWPRVVALIAEGAVIRNSSGRIYVGRGGVDDWRRDTAATTSSRHFETVTVRDLGGGYVLVVGAEHRDPRHGLAEATPGAWIYLVRNGLVSACLYFRTEREAIASLGGPGRGESAADILERCVHAFNRDDFDALVANLHDQVRFRPVLVDGDIFEGIDRFVDALVTLRVSYDEVLVEDIYVDEIGDGCAIATTTIRAIDDNEVATRRLAHAVRIKDGRVAEWLPFERVEAARLAISGDGTYSEPWKTRRESTT